MPRAEPSARSFLKIMHYHRILIAAIIPLAIGLSACGKPQTQQEKLAQESLKARGVDLKHALVFPEDMKFEDEAALTAMCEAFMIAFAQGAIDDAFKVLEGHAAFPAAEWTALREKTKSQLALVGPRYGKFIGHELIESRPAGKSLVRYVYLAKLENNPLRCTFVFYRPADKWILNSFIWDDQFKLLWGPDA